MSLIRQSSSDIQTTLLETEGDFDVISFLNAAPFFETFSQTHIEALSKIAELREIGSDEILQKQGDAATTFNLLVAGKVIDFLAPPLTSIRLI